MIDIDGPPRAKRMGERVIFSARYMQWYMLEDFGIELLGS